MHRTIGLMDYYWTIRVTDYRTNGLSDYQAIKLMDVG